MTHDDLTSRHMAQDDNGSLECEHERLEATHIYGSGERAIYVHHCPDCGFSETGGYEP